MFQLAAVCAALAACAAPRTQTPSQVPLQVAEAATLDLGGGTPGASGFVQVVSTGSPVIGRPFRLGLAGGAAGAPAWFGASLGDAPLPLPAFGATLHLVAPLFLLEPLVLDGAGEATTSLAVPSVAASLAGATFTVQAAVLDPSAAGGLAFSDGRRVTLGADDGWPLFARALVPAADLPLLLVAADMDGDGRLDLVARNRTNGTVSVARGLARGQFAPEVVHDATGFIGLAFLAGLAVGDVDGDGALDVLAGRILPAGVDLLFGNGDGTLGAALHPPLPGGALRDLALADVDGDGDDDLLLRGTDTLWLLRSRGDRTFDAAEELHRAPANSGLWAFAAGDVDGDLDVDLVLSSGTGPIVLANHGSGVFDDEFELPGYGAASALALGDLDRDGFLDLVYAGGGLVRVLHGDGTADFVDSGDEIPIDAVETVQLGDLDGDGELDALIGSQAASQLVLRGDGSGGLGHAPWRLGPSSASLPALGDLDGDGALDVALAMGRHVVQLLSQQQDTLDLPVDPLGAPSGASSAIALRVADLDRDGHLDVLAALADTQDVAAFLGRGDGTLAAPVVSPFGTRVKELLLADHDGDGVLDVFFTAATPKRLGLARGLGDGSFDAPVVLLAGQDLAGLARGDLDGDGVADLLVGQPATMSLVRFDGLVGGSFAAPVALPAGLRASSLQLVDLDGDARLDLVLQSNPDGQLVVARGLGDGTFQTAWQLALGAQSLAPTVYDVDGDGWFDLVLHSALASGAQVELGQGDGTFVPGAVIGVPGPLATHFADVDGDGLADALVVASSYLPGGLVESVLHVERGLGQGHFTSLGRFAATQPAALGDFDGNGLADLATRSWSGNGVEILLNQLLR
jgi:hypothetical protein